jgi:cell fate (sporulation/competence/biofilm development) regulator YlbF (YheA/YmcA/DUF963 family)
VGATGFPSAILVDPQGNIAFAGHPARITDDLVESVLDGALAKPIYEWPKDCASIAKALKKGKLGDAVKKLGSIEDDHPDVAAGADWLRVETMGEELADALKKTPEADRVDEILTALKKDKEAQAILKAQIKIAKLVAGPVKKARYDRTKKQLEKYRDEFKGTAAERDARAAIEKLKDSKRR